MFVQEGDTITMIKDCPFKIGFWSIGDSFIVKTCKKIEPRIDKNGINGVWMTFEEITGRYWLPIDWFKCREDNLRKLLDEI